MPDETGAVAGGPMFELPQLCRYFSELSPQPMVAVEGTTHIVRYVNDAFALLVGTRRADLIGRPFCEAVPEGEDNGCVALLDRVYFTGKSEKLVEQHHTSRTPPAYWTYAVWAMLGLDDRPLGVIIHVTAVTETAIFRKQVTQMNEALVLSSVRQHQLTATADDLNVSLKASEVEYRRLFETSQEQASALTDLHRRKDEFLAMLSHELRNPLTPIANAAQLLRLQLDESPLQQQARTIIERQVGQMTRLIDDLMEVSRITSGRIHLQRERLDLRRIVERARESVDPLVVEHQHVLTLRLPPDPVWLNADATRLEQVLVNLLNNAAKYSDDHSHIWLGLEQEGAEAVLRVHDSGIGIAPHVLPRIFDLFTQAERTLDRSQGGLGIGLALVKELVTMHGGTVEAISALGQGSEFVVRLPIFDCRLPMESKEEDTNRNSAIEIRKSLRVLVVDDNVDAAQSLAQLLEAYGHEVRTAYTGPTALATASEYNPDVMLLDIGLPELDGFQVAKRIRQQTTHNHTVLVALTGYGLEADRQRSNEAGFDHHLVKPASFDDVLQILAAVSPSPSR